MKKINRKSKLRMEPCPFCGETKGVRVVHVLLTFLPWWYYIECEDCHWCGKTKLFVNRAIRAWNKENAAI